MAKSRLLLIAVFSAIVARAGTPDAPGLGENSTLEPLLPLKIPGYELRVLDVGKPIVLFDGGTRFEASLPVFFYLPNSEQIRAAELVKKAYDQLGGLSAKAEWTGDDLRRVLVDLDAALQIFQATTAGPNVHAAAPSQAHP